jgi:carboxypeptidase Q
VRDAGCVKPSRGLCAASLVLLLSLAGHLSAQPATPPAAESTADAIARIRDEGLNRSQVMTTLGHLTDVIGPRLTGSPALRRANEWTRDQLSTWGLANARLEPWGPFGRGWTLRRFSAQVIAPQAIPLIAFPKAWSPSVSPQPVEADVVYVDIKKAEDFEQFRGKLRGKIVLDGAVQPVVVRFEAPATRRNEANLLTLANAGEGPSPASRPAPQNPLATPEQRAATGLLPQRYQFFGEEGVAVLLQPSRQGEAGTFFAQGATAYPPRARGTEAAAAKKDTKKGGGAGGRGGARGVSPWTVDSPPIIPQIAVAAEHYNRLVRMAQAGEKLRAAVELQAEYHSENLMVDNTLADIPGTDLAAQIVMLGAHLDSWQSATGATDNATGCAVVMEVVRILKTLDLKPRRTIRVALWTGEEQGLFGSKAYVTEHFGSVRTAGATPAPASRDESDPTAVPVRTTGGAIDTKPAHAQLSAYFNLDNGSGKIRGIYLQNNEAARGIFRQWLRPFHDLGAETVSLATTSGTDHLSFDAVGLPGFQFIQDDLEYWTRTHHGNMDNYDHAIADDLKQAAVIMAAFVYNAAMADEMIPRKPAPRPAPAPARGAPAPATSPNR